MTNRIEVWSIDGRGSLELSEPRLTPRNAFTCTATLTVDGESSAIELEMITPYRGMWVGYMEELARCSGGWPDTKRWDSEFGELTLTSSNEGAGTVVMDVLIRWPPTYEDEAGGRLLLRAEDVVRMSDELRSFLGLDRGREQRFP